MCSIYRKVQEEEGRKEEEEEDDEEGVHIYLIETIGIGFWMSTDAQPMYVHCTTGATM